MVPWGKSALLPTSTHLSFCCCHCCSNPPLASLHYPPTSNAVLEKNLPPGCSGGSTNSLPTLPPWRTSTITGLECHCLFGVLLLVWEILLATFALTYANSPPIRFFILFAIMTVLLFYMSIKPIYKQSVVTILVSILSFGYLEGGIGIFRSYKSAFLYTSIGIAFIQFLCYRALELLKPCCSWFHRCTPQRKGYLNTDEDFNEIIHERLEDPYTDQITTEETDWSRY